MITLGAIVAPAVQIPERGIAMALFSLSLAVLFQRALGWIEFRSARAEAIIQGKPLILIKDGVLQLSAMNRPRISVHQLFAILRGEGVFNLAEVERFYFEAFGDHSLFKKSEAGPGRATSC